MSEQSTRNPSILSVIVGGGLILLGVLYLGLQLLGRVLGIHLGSVLWPFWIVVPGVILYVWGLGIGHKGGQGLAIAGSLVTMVGLILFFQALTGLWATWAYAWALIAPTSIGLGLMLYGVLKGQPDVLHSGARLAAIGLAVFFGFAIFFELIIGLSGFGLGRAARVVLPLLIVGAGVAVLVVGLLASRRRPQL